jgi:hypothetical protein
MKVVRIKTKIAYPSRAFNWDKIEIVFDPDLKKECSECGHEEEFQSSETDFMLARLLILLLYKCLPGTVWTELIKFTKLTSDQKQDDSRGLEEEVIDYWTVQAYDEEEEW